MREKFKTPREAQVLDTTIDLIKKELSPEKIILFGSRARGTADERADFDIALDCEVPDHTRQRIVKEKIDDAVGLYKIDLVYLKNIQTDFRQLILNTGRVIYER